MQNKGQVPIPWATGRKDQIETFCRKFEILLIVKRKKKSNLIIVLVTATKRDTCLKCFLIMHLSGANFLFA